MLICHRTIQFTKSFWVNVTCTEFLNCTARIMNVRHFHRVGVPSVRNFVTSKCESRTLNHGRAINSITTTDSRSRWLWLWPVLATSPGSKMNQVHTARNISSFPAQRSRAFSGSTGVKSSTDSTKASQRPQGETTIDEEEINKFSRLSALWWDESGEFEPLHALNELRIPLIRDTLVSLKKLDQYDVAKPLEGFWILDVGSGGGILSEPLARLGAFVVGLEASEESIKVAQTHLISDSAIRERIRYIHGTVEEVAESQAGKFDAVVVSEVLEHVIDARMFVTCACKLVRPGGSIFFTTLNKTRLAYLLGIVVAEQLLRLVPQGTHDWEKFVPPAELQDMLEKNNFVTRLIHGMCYNPLSKRWSWVKDTSVNYALHAVKPFSADGQEGNLWVPQDSNKSPID